MAYFGILLGDYGMAKPNLYMQNGIGQASGIVEHPYGVFYPTIDTKQLLVSNIIIDSWSAYT